MHVLVVLENIYKIYIYMFKIIKLTISASRKNYIHIYSILNFVIIYIYIFIGWKIRNTLFEEITSISALIKDL